MKIGIISDVHNNVVALKIVLEELTSRGCEKIICAGDIIGIGPSPEETVSELLKYKDILHAVQGNHEHYLTRGMTKITMSEQEYNYHMWEHERLSIKSVQFLSSLPNSVNLTIKGKKILIIHYASINERFKRPIPNPDASSIKAEFNVSEADIIIYGHNHSESYIEDNTIYINPGSLGCPGRKQDIARAGVLEIDNDTKYEQLEIKYDVNKVLNKIEEYDYPAKEEIKKFFFGINR